MLTRILAVMVALASVAVPAAAQTPLDEHTPNLTRVAKIAYDGGTDLAFQGNYVFAGDWDGADSGFRVIDVSDPSRPKVVGHFVCPGSQNDVSVWGDLLFMSVDGRRSDQSCDATSGGGKTEGVRIIDISNFASPRQIKFVQTECGSHTHTLLPDLARNRLLLYVQSSAPGVRTEATDGRDDLCNRATHSRQSVIEVPLGNPRAARVASLPSVAYGPPSLQAGTPFQGCHDVTLFMPRKLAGAACLDETQMWDLSDPVNPRILAHIPSSVDAPLDIHHTTGFSWDGSIMALGDEAGGRSGPACTGLPDDRLGALYFFDVSDPTGPVLKGRFSLPRPRIANCTAHNFNVVPVEDRNILVMAWYTGGINVIDFTDPAAPREIAHYWTPQGDPLGADPLGTIPDSEMFDTWSAYWYNGYIYVNGFDGFSVYKLDDPAVAGAANLDRLNPQSQIFWRTPAPVPAKPPSSKPVVLGSKLPSTGVGTPWTSGALALAVAASLGVAVRRRA